MGTNGRYIVDWYSSAKDQVNQRLCALISELAYPDPDSTPSAALMRAVAEQAHSSDEGGKRLRALGLLAFSALNPRSDARNNSEAISSPAATPTSEPLDPFALDLACALELFQTGALVHDDIMDESVLRRGEDSAWVALAQQYSHYSELFHTSVDQHSQVVGGRGLAIMLGDLFATISLIAANNACSQAQAETAVHLRTEPQAHAQTHAEPQAHAESQTAAQLSSAVMTAMLTMQREVEIGQVLDQANSITPLDNPEEIVANCWSVYERKTASYTSIIPFTLGLLCAGLDENFARLSGFEIGRPVGIGFQIHDDLMDVVPSNPPTGKPLGGDIREGKRTILLADALILADPDERHTLINLYSKSARTNEDVAQVMAIFQRSGAIERSWQRLQQLKHSSDEALDKLEHVLHAQACGQDEPQAQHQPQASPISEQAWERVRFICARMLGVK